MNEGMVSGNSISLLVNGDEFFARILEVIDAAEREILIETFMLQDDLVGRKVQHGLIDAARRGVWVSVLADGYGTHFLPQSFIDEMRAAGIVFRLYHPQPQWLRIRTNIFKRLHRKILVADGHTAFVGGINLEANHLSEFDAECKQDYAAEIQGPIVRDIQQFARQAIQAQFDKKFDFVRHRANPGSEIQSQDAILQLVTRDNDRFRTSIEDQYLERIRAAEHRITIANCYFFPGYRILKALRDAARRGVEVRLLTQGKPDSIMAKRAAFTIYDFLVKSDIQVYEYWERRLHAKIAAFDNEWATIGSSNLDPLSFFLNLEANIFVRDHDFNRQTQEAIENLINRSNVIKINDSWLEQRTLLMGFLSFLSYHLVRHLPGLTAWVHKRERASETGPGHLRSRNPGSDRRRNHG